jgi:hypothetical protein
VLLYRLRYIDLNSLVDLINFSALFSLSDHQLFEPSIFVAAFQEFLSPFVKKSLIARAYQDIQLNIVQFDASELVDQSVVVGKDSAQFLVRDWLQKYVGRFLVVVREGLEYLVHALRGEVSV